MKFRNLSTALLLITLSATSTFALGFGKKAPKPTKYSQVHQLTPEQAALVERAIGREKVLIRLIFRTPSRTSSSTRCRSPTSTC